MARTPELRRVGPVAWLEGARAVVVVLVLLDAAWLLATDPGTASEHRASVRFHCALAVLVVLGGVAVGRSSLKPDLTLRAGAGAFLLRRAWRILPPYWAALALSAGVDAALLHELTPRSVLVHALLLQNLVAVPPVAATFWSIAVLVQVYLLLPPLLLAARRSSTARVGCVLLLLLATLVVVEVTAGVPEAVGAVNAHFVLLFGCGLASTQPFRVPSPLSGVLPLRGPGSPATRRRSAVGLGAALVLAVVVTDGAVVPGPALLDELVVGLYAAGVCRTYLTLGRRSRAGRLRMAYWWAVGRGARSFRPLSSPWLRALGRRSYSLYLVQAPVVVLTSRALDPHVSHPVTHATTTALVAVPATVAVGWAFHWAVERHFLRLPGALAREVPRTATSTIRELDLVSGAGSADATVIDLTTRVASRSASSSTTRA